MEEAKVRNSKTRKRAFFQKPTHGEEKASGNRSAAKAPRSGVPGKTGVV